MSPQALWIVRLNVEPVGWSILQHAQRNLWKAELNAVASMLLSCGLSCLSLQGGAGE